jgi:S-adenosylmethionine:tRNA ribosyltransferase-isomerase
VRTSDFDYHLPQGHIAQRPAERRDHSRLLVLDRPSGNVKHRLFYEILDFLRPGDVLVLNETRVLTARLKARKQPTGGLVEILLLRRDQPRRWQAMVGGKGVRRGLRLELEDGTRVEVVEDLGHARRLIEFEKPIIDRLDSLGEMPTPPYIHAPLQNPKEYQTVFARVDGSAAAPTAGLHFTPALLESLASKGVRQVKITLHIGLDTFAPVRAEEPGDHIIHSEWCQVDSEAADIVNASSAAGGKIFAVGTTSVRALETAAALAEKGDRVGVFEGETNLFILPGHHFRAVDSLVTNFHLPRSTLLMMISAFAGRERILDTYRLAIREGYRFYSFGDAMLIL